MAKQSMSRRSGRERTPRGKKDGQELGDDKPPALAFKMPADTSPTPPGRVKVSASAFDLTPPPPEKDPDGRKEQQLGEVEARLQSLELTVGSLEKNLTDRIQETVGSAMLAAMREERERIPQWASSFQTSLSALEGSLKFIHDANHEAAEKIRGCEGAIMHLQQQVGECFCNVHPIYLAERAAMLATAEQTRVGGFKDGDNGEKFLQEYVKTKFPTFGKVSVNKNGPGTFVATFQKAEEAKIAAKSLRVDRKDLSVRPQLPSVVLESQGPLKRAYGALVELAKTEKLPADLNLKEFKINYKERTISNGELWLARQLADGNIEVWNPVLGQECSDRVLSASRSLGDSKGQGPGKGVSEEKGKSSKPKGKGKGPGKKMRNSDMDVDPK